MYDKEPQEKQMSDKINRLLARLFGTYQVFRNEHIDGEVRGWVWRGWLYIDMRH